MITPVHRRRLFAAVAAVSLLAGIAIASPWATRWFLTAWHGAGIGRLEVAIDGRATLSDVVLPLGDGAVLRIGQLQFQSGFALVTPASAAENVTLRDVTLNFGGASYRMSRVEFVGSALGQQDLAALLNSNNPQPIAERLALLTAASATIPEIVIEYSRVGGNQTITGRDLVLRSIAAGKVGTAAIAGGTVKGPLTNDEGSFGAVAITDLDLALATRLFTDAPVADNREPGRVVGSMIWNNFDFKSTTGASLHTDRMALTDFRAKAGALKDWPKTNGPLLGSVAIAGVVADIPDSKAKDEPWKWQLKSFVLAADLPRNGIPTHLQATMQGFSYALSPGAQRGMNLREMGYERVDISLGVEGNWDEPSSEFAVKKVGLDVVGVGSISLQGKLGNITKDIFASDSAAATAARGRATAKSFDLLIEDKGLFERLVAREAKKDGKPLDEVRNDFARRATRIFPTALGNSPGARLLSVAIVEFAKKPGVLEITMKSKSQSGVALGDFNAAAGNSGEILEKLDVKATAR